MTGECFLNKSVQRCSKSHLFFRRLFFDPLKDNIMNVEPGILVMYHSIRTHPLVSTTCLDFLCRTMRNFYPKGEDRIRAGVYNSLNKILEKQVIPNLYPLFESPKLDRDLKQMIRENFREYCSPPSNDLNSYNAIAVADEKNSQYHHLMVEDAAASARVANFSMNQQQLSSPVKNDLETQINDNNLYNSMAAITGEGASSSSAVSSIIGSTSGVTNSFLLSTLSSVHGGGSNDPKFSDEEDEVKEKIVVSSVKTKAVAKLEEDTDDDDLPLSKVSQKVSWFMIVLYITFNEYISGSLEVRYVRSSGNDI
jgi:hypothetical protein